MGIFQDISEEVGDSFNSPVVGRGIATADFDRDGDLDVLLTVNGGSPKLFRNDSPKINGAVRIRLKGKKPNMNAVGALVYVWKEGVCQQRMLRTGSSYLSQSDISELVVGLGQHKTADSVQVTWPRTGKKTVIRDFEPGKPIVIVEE